MLLWSCSAWSAPAAQPKDNGKTPAVGEALKAESKSPPPGREPAPPVVRGQLLYENHCTSCHESTLHVREQRRAKSLADLRGWAIHWSNHLRLDWGSEEVDDVVRYLNGRYYGLPPDTK
jgi:mono/diheme cytochrome c family protein